MSLFELMICQREGCKHARHRHTRAPGNAWRNFKGACRAGDGATACRCDSFIEKAEDYVTPGEKCPTCGTGGVEQ